MYVCLIIASLLIYFLQIDFIDTATRGDALHQSIVGQKDAVRERLGDNDGKKVKLTRVYYSTYAL